MLRYNSSLLEEVGVAQARCRGLSEVHVNLLEELEVAKHNREAVNGVIVDERDAVVRLCDALAILSSELAKDRQVHSQQRISPEKLLWDEEAVRAEARALTFEVSELEAGLDAAIAMQRTSKTGRSASAQRRGGPAPPSPRTS